jgi:hypothetical protein
METKFQSCKEIKITTRNYSTSIPSKKWSTWHHSKSKTKICSEVSRCKEWDTKNWMQHKRCSYILYFVLKTWSMKHIQHKKECFK